jgi:hypothetical protein
MAEENSNIKESNELLKLAHVLDPNSPSELEIQWYMAIKQIGGVQQALKAVNSCKPLLSKVLLVMKSVHDIVTVAKNSESSISADLTTQLSPHINLSSVCESSKATESNTSRDTNKYNTVENELETSSKKQKTLMSYSLQTRHTHTSIIDHGASCSYRIMPNNFAVNLKEFADPNWDSDVPSTMSAEIIPRPYKQNMQTFFKFTKNNLEDMFFNAADSELLWFTKGGISDTISFYPNQIRFLSPTIKQNKGLIYLFFNDEIPFGIFPHNLDLNQFVYLNTMAVTIFRDNFMDNLEWSNLKTTSDIAITSLYLINDKIGSWYEYIERQNIWDYRKFWTCKMWVVWIVLKLLLNLVAEKIISERTAIENSTTNKTKGKATLPVPNYGQFSK